MKVSEYKQDDVRDRTFDSSRFFAQNKMNLYSVITLISSLESSLCQPVNVLRAYPIVYLSQIEASWKNEMRIFEIS
jgi:hypothetical protein